MTHTHRNALITKNRKWNRVMGTAYPCWCGHSLTNRYRAMAPCCSVYIRSLKKFLRGVRWMDEQEDEERERLGALIEDEGFEPFPWNFPESAVDLIREWVESQLTQFIVEDNVLVGVVHRHLEDCSRCNRLFAEDNDPEGSEGTMCVSCWEEALK